MNLLKESDYYSQRNNTVNPHGACNVTACIMALIESGWKLNIYKMTKKNQQPEDVLYRHIMNSDYVKKSLQAHLYPEYYQYYLDNPSMIPLLSAGLLYGVNEWLGEEIITLHEGPPIGDTLTTKAIINHLDNGCGVVVNGYFAGLDHYVCLGGFTEHFIINDPYGDYHTQYKKTNGYGIRMPKNDFHKNVKTCGQNKKLALVFNKKDET